MSDAPDLGELCAWLAVVRQSKVCHLERGAHELVSEEKVLGFYVSVDDAPAVALLRDAEDVAHEHRGHLLRVGIALADLLKEVAACARARENECQSVWDTEKEAGGGGGEG